ncbi:MAG: Hsp20/alpha crystallin family protein [Desulfobacteraceae bacterium]|nr:Hsp20/alpha crystallin family protein [Desulfobacteraceae bacterium]
MFAKLSNGLDIAIQQAVEKARDNNFFEAGTTGSGVYPFINLFEKEGDLVLAAELPGVKKEDLSLEVREDVLRLAGTRKIEYGENCSCHRLERKGLNFDRSLKLPFRIEGGKIHAEFKNGLLMVILPRAEADKPKKIVIN